MINLRNKNQPDALSFLIYFINYPLHVSNWWTIHPQEPVYCICSLCYLSCIHVDWLLTRSRFHLDRVNDQVNGSVWALTARKIRINVAVRAGDAVMQHCLCTFKLLCVLNMLEMAQEVFFRNKDWTVKSLSEAKLIGPSIFIKKDIFPVFYKVLRICPFFFMAGFWYCNISSILPFISGLPRVVVFLILFHRWTVEQFVMFPFSSNSLLHPLCCTDICLHLFWCYVIHSCYYFSCHMFSKLFLICQ